MAEIDGLPMGLSLIAAAGADEMLLALAQEMFEILV
jgi:Asp-tRNA(Asn)/Glu-tRNA(Gln) amidotransferase A subunit family amidase